MGAETKVKGPQGRTFNDPATRLEKRAFLERLRLGLKTDRSSSWDPHWNALAKMIVPRHARFLGDQASQAKSAGERMDQLIVDPTATEAARIAAAGIHSGMTDPASPWFAMTTVDPSLRDNHNVAIYLSDVADALREIFLQSNFYDTLPQTYLDMVVFGTSAFELLEDDTDTIRCYSYPIGSYYLGTSARNVIDTLVRELPMSIRQMCERFGYANLSSGSKAQYDNGNRETVITCVHVVRPNPHYKMDSMEPTERKWESVYYELGVTGPDDQTIFLQESGFYEFPIMAPRWGVIGEDTYGWSPGMDVLGDVRELQTLVRRYAEAVYKMVTPPMIGPAALVNKAIRNTPGGVTYADMAGERDGLRPLYQVNLPLNYLAEYIREKQGSIKRVFHSDLFLSMTQLDRRQITAEEIRARQRESVKMLSTVINRTMGELLRPSIERTFAVAQRTGKLPNPPAEMDNKPIKLEFVSPMAQMLKAAGLAGTQEFILGVVQLTPVVPNAMDKIDTDEFIDVSAAAAGINPKILRSDEDVQALRQQRAQEQQAQQKAAMAQQLSQTAKNANDALQPAADGSANPLSSLLTGA